MEVRNNQRKRREDHAKRQKVHANRIRQEIVHGIHIPREPIRDAPKRRRVKEGHRRPQRPRDRPVQHHLTRCRTKHGERYRECEH